MKRKVLLQTGLVLALVGAGLALGMGLEHTVSQLSTRGDHAHGEPEHVEHELPHEDDPEEDHLHLTRQARENLRLVTGEVTLEDYRQTIRIPGEVVEIPGRSSRSIAAPVTGIIDRVYVDAGQVVPTDAVLMEMEITDEQLIAGQVALLDLTSQLAVAERELTRLAPLTESGAVAGRRRLELEYETQQLEAKLGARVQELRLRGLTAEQVASVRENGQLVQRIVVRLPRVASDSEPSPMADPANIPAGTAARRAQASLAGDASPVDDGVFTVERLNVHPGTSVVRGDELCGLADHRWLYIRGEAFEEDIEDIARLRSLGWTVTAEFGHQHASAHEHLGRQEGLEVAYVDNHVDPETRTFRFYLRLQNEAESEYQSSEGISFREWRYKPGQLAHLFVPVKAWRQQIKLPIDAIVEEGPDVFVFRLHEEDDHTHAHPHPPGEHAHDHDDEHAHHAEHEHDDEHAEEEEHGVEFEPVPVHLLHRDSRYAIVADDGPLKPGDVVALNQAYQLHLAMKMQSGAGGHHDHDH